MKEMQEAAANDCNKLLYVEDDDIMWQYEEVIAGSELTDVVLEDDDILWQDEEQLLS